MKKFFCTVLCLMLAAVFSGCNGGASSPADTSVGTPSEKLAEILYISPYGSDSGDGSEEKPFATVEAARDAIREKKSSAGLPDGGITVLIKNGTYSIAEPIEFRGEDSGETGKPIVYTAEEKGSVIFDGGVPFDISNGETENETPIIIGRSVNYIEFDGITFENASGAAIIFELDGADSERMTDISVRNCTVRNIGGTAVIISDAVNTAIENNDIYNVGGGGIYLENRDTENSAPAKNIIHDNLVHDFNKIKNVNGICVRGVGFTVSNNEVYNGNYCAITAYTRDSMIQYNICHNVNYTGGNLFGAITVDGSWANIGNVIRYNYIYDILYHIPNKPGVENPMPSGIHIDNTLPEQYIYGNTIFNVHGNGITAGSGKNITVRNNVLMNVGYAPICIHDPSTKKDELAYNGGYTGYWEELQKMNYTSEYLLSMYPELSLILEVGGSPFYADDPASQSYAIVEGNALYGREGMHDSFPRDYITESPFELISYDDVVLAGGRTYSYGSVRNNVAYHTWPKYGIGTCGKVEHALTAESQIYCDVVGFQRIPYEMIGNIDMEAKEK